MNRHRSADQNGKGSASEESCKNLGALGGSARNAGKKRLSPVARSESDRRDAYACQYVCTKGKRSAVRWHRERTQGDNDTSCRAYDAKSADRADGGQPRRATKQDTDSQRQQHRPHQSGSAAGSVSRKLRPDHHSTSAATADGDDARPE